MPILYMKAGLKFVSQVKFHRTCRLGSIVYTSFGGASNGGSFMKHAVRSDNYLNSKKEDKSFFGTWVLPALIFIVMVAIGVHTYLVAVGSY